MAGGGSVMVNVKLIYSINCTKNYCSGCKYLGLNYVNDFTCNLFEVDLQSDENNANAVLRSVCCLNAETSEVAA